MVFIDLGPEETLVMLPVSGRDWICSGCGGVEKWRESSDTSGVIAGSHIVQRPVTRNGHLGVKGQKLYHARCVPEEWWAAAPTARQYLTEHLLFEAWRAAEAHGLVPWNSRPWASFPKFRLASPPSRAPRKARGR